jgi:hypothetical protein
LRRCAARRAEQSTETKCSSRICQHGALEHLRTQRPHDWTALCVMSDSFTLPHRGAMCARKMPVYRSRVVGLRRVWLVSHRSAQGARANLDAEGSLYALVSFADSTVSLRSALRPLGGRSMRWPNRSDEVTDVSLTAVMRHDTISGRPYRVESGCHRFLHLDRPWGPVVVIADPAGDRDGQLTLSR